MDNSRNNDMRFVADIIKMLPHYEHMELIDAKSNNSEKGEDVTYKDLVGTRKAGNVTSSYRDGKGELHYVMDKLGHEVIVGGTGSGKSTGPINAQIDAGSLAGYSMAIVDTKGELYESNAARLEKRGYDVRLINIKDAQHSEKINPLYKGAKLILSLKNVGTNVICKDEHGKKCYKYKGRAYHSQKSLQEVFSYEITNVYNQVQKEFRSVVAKLWPVESEKDPMWEKNAWKMLIALAFALASDQLETDTNKKTDIKQVNFANMKAIFDSFENGRRGGLNDRGFFSRRGYDSFVYSEVKRIFFENADTTMRNFLGFVDDAFSKYNFPGFMELTLTNSFHMEDFIDKPTALFIVYDEMDILSQSFLSYNISYMLEELKLIADARPSLCLPSPVLFIIDEFATLPKNEHIANFIAFGRSRKIFIHFVLQSYSQLMSKYGELGKSLLENCNNTIFLSTNDFKTIQDFSVELGKCTIIAPGSELYNGALRLEERPIVTCSNLSALKQGEAYVKRNGKMPLKACFEKSYECAEYKCPRKKLSDYPNPLDGERAQYDYDVTKIREEVDDDDDDDLFNF